jgi:hypothetical protein
LHKRIHKKPYVFLKKPGYIIQKCSISLEKWIRSRKVPEDANGKQKDCLRRNKKKNAYSAKEEVEVATPKTIKLFPLIGTPNAKI